MGGGSEGGRVREKWACGGGPGGDTVLRFDIAGTAQGEEAVRAVLADFERLDVLVESAGISQRALAHEAELAVDHRPGSTAIGPRSGALPTRPARAAGAA